MSELKFVNGTQISLIFDDRQHFGCSRQLPPNPLFHTSVKTRMDNPSVKYEPRALYEHGTEKYVS